MATQRNSSDRVVRHKGPDRIFHWVMAVTVLTLLATAFLPIAGVQFPWVTIHWIAGVVLAAIVLYHIVRALVWLDWRAMLLIDGGDVRRAMQSMQWMMRTRAAPADRPGKYPLLQKLYHYGIMVMILALVVTGLMMLAKVDGPFWRRDPYFFSTDTWAAVYVIHDLAAMAALAMVIVHVYFAIRPEKLWITRSMILGWITREEYVEHHDPALWRTEPDKAQASPHASGRAAE